MTPLYNACELLSVVNAGGQNTFHLANAVCRHARLQCLLDAACFFMFYSKGPSRYSSFVGVTLLGPVYTKAAKKLREYCPPPPPSKKRTLLGNFLRLREFFFFFKTIPRLYLSGKFSFVVTITAYTSIDMLLIAW
jgi:hypothetical protein